ncbi:transporter substrate-binding domain-containing protein [Halarcobacter ebronensis]|uniref:transporter substrate-binding domain-containing protein n=1 Tax=Halarcobacter ebronensis TaxID=1462615 RepID=UPI003C77F099
MCFKRVFLFFLIFLSTLCAQAFNKAEKQWISQNPVVSISMLNNFEPFSYETRDIHKGFTLDILKRVEKISGLKFDIKTSKWSEAISNFEEKRVDVISEISYTKERSKYAAFTTAYYEIPTFIFGLKSDTNFKSVKNLKGKVVAVSRGLFYIKLLKELGIKVIELDSSFEKAQAVVTGKADYFLASYTTGQKAISDNTFYTLKVLGEFTAIKKEDLRFATHKENSILRDILQKSLNKITQEELTFLAKKWINNNKFDSQIDFTPEEVAFIRANPIVKYSEVNWKPLSIIEDNKMKGIMGEYLDLVSQRTGLKFEFVASKSWPHVLEQFKEGKIDLVPGVGSSPQEKQLGLISNRYAKYPFVIVTNDRYTYLESLMDLKDAVIAVPKSYTSYNFIVKNYPEMNLLLTEDIPEALIAVENGKADAFVGHIATSLYYISELHLKNLKVAGTTIFDIEHHYLIQKDMPLLLSIINKAFNSITLQERKNINANWIQTTVVEKKIDYKLVFLAFFIFIIILAVFIYRHSILKKYNERLKDSYADIESIMNSTMEAILITENRKCIEVNDSAVKLFGYASKEEMIGQDLLNFIAKDHRKLVKSKITATVKEPYELEILTARGKNIQTLGKGANLKLSGKNVRISSIIDITDIKSKEKLLIEQSKMAALGEMIGHIAHQWRQPLSVITVVATSWEVYDELGTFDKKKVLEEGKLILSNAKYLSQTIDDFRQFIKGENSSTAFNVKDLIGNLSRLVNPSIQNEQITFILNNNIEKELLGGQNNILQALINIINNSIDALRHKENERFIFLDVKENEDKKVQIIIKDNAGGIDKKIIDKIFEPYFTTKHQSQGTGLGLYMTYSILEKANASIDVENCEYSYNKKKYKGVTFTITFQ